MHFVVYILYSHSLDQYYVGYTQNLENRIKRHNHHGSKSTKKATDWQIVYQELYASRSEAMRRETAIKLKKSRRYIESLL